MTSRLVSIPALTLSLLIIGGSARRLWAQNAVEQRFDELDRNGDGGVTPDELPAAEFFRRLDLDGDGVIRKPEAVEAVRSGALQGMRGPAGTAPSAPAAAAAEPATPAPAEPPVRQGPRPVRPGDHGIGRRVADATFTDLAGSPRWPTAGSRGLSGGTASSATATAASVRSRSTPTTTWSHTRRWSVRWSSAA